MSSLLRWQQDVASNVSTDVIWRQQPRKDDQLSETSADRRYCRSSCLCGCQLRVFSSLTARLHLTDRGRHRPKEPIDLSARVETAQAYADKTAGLLFVASHGQQH